MKIFWSIHIGLNWNVNFKNWDKNLKIYEHFFKSTRSWIFNIVHFYVYFSFILEPLDDSWKIKRSMHVSLTKWSMHCEMHAAAIFVIAFDCARYFSHSERRIKIKFINTCSCVVLDAASIISHFTVCVQWKQSKMQWKVNIWWFVCYFRDFPSLCSFYSLW